MGDLFRVLVSPTATFENIRDERGARWVLTLVVLTALSILAYWLALPATLSFTEAAYRHQVELTGGKMDPAILNTVLGTAVVSGYASNVMGIAIRMFIGGLLLMMVNQLVQGEATFMQLSKTMLYATIPSVISSLISGLLVRLTHTSSPLHVSLNAGVFFSVKNGVGYSIASLIDPFQIYSLVLIIIGTAVMTRRPRSKVATWVIAGWLLFAIIGIMTVGLQK